jgi:hypothetical protein
MPVGKSDVDTDCDGAGAVDTDNSDDVRISIVGVHAESRNGFLSKSGSNINRACETGAVACGACSWSAALGGSTDASELFRVLRATRERGFGELARARKDDAFPLAGAREDDALALTGPREPDASVLTGAREGVTEGDADSDCGGESSSCSSKP